MKPKEVEVIELVEEEFVANPYLQDNVYTVAAFLYGKDFEKTIDEGADYHDNPLSSIVLDFYRDNFLDGNAIPYFHQTREIFTKSLNEDERLCTVFYLLTTGVFGFWDDEGNDYEFHFDNAKNLIQYSQELKKALNKKNKK